ncbi:MAG: ribosome biogenesis GTPase Der [Lachnospiraceae bacterium]|nr:ribosome biogenesis GTPase Der [Lachnospiraceae bacterium]
MKRKPVVAIVGRPNVGKSTLFNALAGEKAAIVKDTPGVTRDRLYRDTDWAGHAFLLADTGGIEPESKDLIFAQMREQAQIAIDTADVILFMCDLKSGVTDADLDIATMIRKSGRPIVLAVNKVDDHVRQEAEVYEFYNLGLGEPHPVSAEGRRGIGELLDAVCVHLPAIPEDDEEDTDIRVAVIGRPNAGKSSLINRLTGENRLIVSDVAGTTRDAIDTRVRCDGREYVFIDTAGLRRKSKIKEDLERYMILRAVSAIERSDVCVLMIDAVDHVTEQDAHIAGIAHERGKGMIIAVNKWDLVEKDNRTVKEYTDRIREVLSFMPYAEILFLSAKSGQRTGRLFPLIDKVADNASLRITTGLLNDVLTKALAMQQPPTDKGRPLRVYYMTQTGVKPPTFVLFVNDKKLMHYSYTRYIENRIRETFGFQGTPLRFLIRERKDKQGA